MAKHLPKNPYFHAFLLFLIIFFPAWLSLSSLTFFASDNGLRYLQVRELVDQRWHTLAIDYPLRTADSGLEHIPYYSAYLIIKDEIFLATSPFFPLIASFLYALVGKPGLALLPAAGAVFAALALYWLARLARVPNTRWLLWGAVLATPLLFYTLTFWDMTLGTAFAVGAVVFAALGILQQKRWPLALAGVAVSLGFAQRIELAVFGVALFLALLVTQPWDWRGLAAYAGGGMLGLVPTGLLNLRWVAYPMGSVVAKRLGYGVPGSYLYHRQAISGAPQAMGGVASLIADLRRLGEAFMYVQGENPDTFIAVLLLVLAITLVLFALRVRRFQRPQYLIVGFGLALGAYALWARAGWNTAIKGVLSTFPLILFSLVYVDGDTDPSWRRRVYLLVLSTVWIFVALLMALLGGPGGLQWGVRYLLPVFPLLLFLSFYVYDVYRQRLASGPRRALRVGFGALFIASVLLQLVGVRYLFHQKREYATTKQFLANLPADVLITDHPYLPSLMAGLEEKEFLYVIDEQGLRSLLPSLQESGVQRFAVLTYGSPLSVPARVGGAEIVPEGDFVYHFATTEMRGIDDIGAKEPD